MKQMITVTDIDIRKTRERQAKLGHINSAAYQEFILNLTWGKSCSIFFLWHENSWSSSITIMEVQIRAQQQFPWIDQLQIPEEKRTLSQSTYF